MKGISRGHGASYPRAFELLEPCDGKLSCTVLRGGSGGNTASSPDRNNLSKRGDEIMKSLQISTTDKFTLDSCLHSPREVYSREITPDVWMLLDVERPNWIVVDNLGKRIVELCNGNNSLRTITEILCSEFGGGFDDSKEHVISFAGLLADEDFLSPRPVTHICKTKSEVTGINTLWINVTNRCNLRCLHCFRNAGKVMNNELSTKEIFRVLDEFERLGGSELVISGGEPLLRKKLLDILKYAKGKVQKVKLVTNGTVLSYEIAQALKKLEPIYIQVSVDGATENTNDKIRGKGSFQQAIDGVKNLKRANFKHMLALSMTIMKSNLHEIEKFVDLAQSLEVPMIHFPIFQNIGRGAENVEILGLTPKDMIHALGHLIDVQSDDSIKIEFSLTPETFQYIKGYQRDYCGAGIALWNIEPDGRVTPCAGLTDEKFTAGSIREQSLSEIIHTSIIGEKFRSLHVYQTPKCAVCELRFICGGGCHVDNHTRYGELVGRGSHLDCTERMWYWEMLKESALKNLNDI